MSLLIGLYIKKTLEGCEPLQRLTGGRICPVVFPDDSDTPAPYVVYSRTSYSEDGSKDGTHGSTCSVDIECVGRNYEEMLTLCHTVMEAVREDLKARGGQFDDLPFSVADIDITAGAEEFDAMTCEYLSSVRLMIETEEHDSIPPYSFAMNFPLSATGRDIEED